MLLSLILRNILRNLARLSPMIAVLALSFAALFVGNGVLQASVEALRETYADHVSGELSVSAAAEERFTVFGSEQLLVGQYLVPPTIVGFDELRRTAEEFPGVRGATGLISSAARVRISGTTREQLLFGVDFEAYSRMFPDLQLVSGSFPEPGERGIVLQESWAEGVVGRSALLSVAYDSSFTLRGVPVTGIFRYPVADETLERIALVDPVTARSLNGYIRGAASPAEVPEGQQQLLESDMDSMFGGGSAEPGDTERDDTEITGDSETGDSDSGAIDPTAPLGSDTGRQQEAREARETIEGAWNFLLLDLADGASIGSVSRSLADTGYTEESGYLVRDWRDTVGGNATIVTYLQLMFNAGLLFVAFGAAIITTNALVLSVLERTREIGTMRALGASKPRIAAMIGLETLFVVLGSAILGILLGAGAIELLNRSAIAIENRYFDILFGGDPLRGTPSGGLVFGHLLAAAGLAAVAVIYPLKRALGILPVEAMSQ